MSILGWIFFGAGLLVLSFFGYILGSIIIKGGSSDDTGTTEGCLAFGIPMIGLIAGIYAKYTILENIWLILALTGGISLIISVIVVRLTAPPIPPIVTKLKAEGDVEELTKMLDHEKKGMRQNAAKALVKMRRLGELNEEQKQLLLAQHDKIITKHSDKIDHFDHPGRQYHYDKLCGGGGPFQPPVHNDQPAGHSDNKRHTDTGIGINFPL